LQKTVREWLGTDDNKQRMDLVIFNVFTPRYDVTITRASRQSFFSLFSPTIRSSAD
jgi:hypothetical protein